MSANLHSLVAPLPSPSNLTNVTNLTNAAGPRCGGQVLELTARQHLRLLDARDWRVVVLEGELWITQDGDLRDVVLSRGEEHVIDRDGLALLSPMGHARFAIHGNQPGHQGGLRNTRRTAFSLQPALA
ncbi:DUF2917 domain-containing protein [Noviherbaspirillum galbum]|uniref:DUF2917 domain-containing protein n=1 Tax=Noviherbaspirillum galbum TaxID=2709383 RepID=A0A6B3SJL0_9BURK|nr:DUF2917 domain-containing protein [Noviherbaspirillum galbum]NEX60910.1 DUF2917 domain-containing protein [Noviherbaspirillum galbum]